MAFSAIEPGLVSVFNKPNGGIVFFAPKGTAVPTQLTQPSALGAAFASLGDLGKDGFVESRESDSEDYEDINGDVVLTVGKKKSRKWKMTLIETERPKVQEIVNGAVVTNTDGTIKSVKLSTLDNAEGVMVIYELLSSGTLRMVVLDRAKPEVTGDVTHSKGDLIGHEITVNAFDKGDSSVGMAYYGTAIGGDA